MNKKKQVRIIKRIGVDGCYSYVIQQRHWLFPSWWVDAHANSWDFAGCQDEFLSLDRAKQYLCYFDGSMPTEEVVEETNSDQEVKETLMKEMVDDLGYSHDQLKSGRLIHDFCDMLIRKGWRKMK
jgi:hypothetical protein